MMFEELHTYDEVLLHALHTYNNNTIVSTVGSAIAHVLILATGQDAERVQVGGWRRCSAHVQDLIRPRRVGDARNCEPG